MPRAARVGVDPQRGSIFLSDNKYGKLLLHQDDVPRAKTEYERSRAMNSRNLAAAIWHGRNSEQRRF